MCLGKNPFLCVQGVVATDHKRQKMAKKSTLMWHWTQFSTGRSVTLDVVVSKLCLRCRSSRSSVMFEKKNPLLFSRGAVSTDPTGQKTANNGTRCVTQCFSQAEVHTWRLLGQSVSWCCWSCGNRSRHRIKLWVLCAPISLNRKSAKENGYKNHN